MFGFFKRKRAAAEIVDNLEKDRNDPENMDSKIGGGYAAAQEAFLATQRAAKIYAKPETYTGNRTLYENKKAMGNAKKAAFKSGNEVYDPYTEQRLFLSTKEAKALYGDDWANHLAETDHIYPLKKIFGEAGKRPWITNDNIRDTANSEDNFRPVSRKYNNAKRSRTNEEFIEDDEYLQKTGVKLTNEGKANAKRDSESAYKKINNRLNITGVKNMFRTGHEAGKNGAQNAGLTALTMSGIMNLISVIKGEKNSEDAVADTIADGGEAALAGYAMSGGLTIVSHSLSYSSPFIQGLINSNVPGKVITAILVVGDTIKKYADGEITTQECLLELGDKGLNLATMGYSMAVGQAIIPIPIIGGAIGALVGSALTSTYYNNLIQTLQMKELEHQERMRIIAECRMAAEQTKAFRKELESYLESYFKDFRDCFDSALSSMRFAYQAGDADGMIAGANDITRKLGGQIHYETVEEFKSFLDDSSIDLL